MTRIVFNNGTELLAEQNGTTFSASKKPDFPEDMSNITIEGESATVIENGMLVECYCPDNNYYFSIIEKPYQTVLEERLQEQDDIICELLEMLLETQEGEDKEILHSIIKTFKKPECKSKGKK